MEIVAVLLAVLFASGLDKAKVESLRVEDIDYRCVVPGVQYPSYSTIPETNFNCSEQAFIPGFYADVETGCQVYHVCASNGRLGSLLCPEQTIFDQKKMRCDTWTNSNCSEAPSLYFYSNRMFRLFSNPNIFDPDEYADTKQYTINLLTGLMNSIFDVTEEYGKPTGSSSEGTGPELYADNLRYRDFYYDVGSYFFPE